MSRFLTRVLAFAALIVVQTAPTVARTFWCDASKTQAGIGIADIFAVSVTAIRDKQECRFAINGETVGSPPRELVIGAYNALRDGKILKRLESGEVEVLGVALVASSPQPDVPPKLIHLLHDYGKELTTCFKQLAEGAAAKVISKDNILCQVASQKGERLEVGFSKGVIQVDPSKYSDFPILVLGVTDGLMEHYLFAPAPYISGRLPPLE